MGVRRCWVAGGSRSAEHHFVQTQEKALQVIPCNAAGIVASFENSISVTNALRRRRHFRSCDPELGLTQWPDQADVDLPFHEAPFLGRSELAQHVIECRLVGRCKVKKSLEIKRRRSFQVAAVKQSTGDSRKVA
ncbi:hypothetical protein RGCCGE502_21870 [Rhizobium grahamii CCGE 502]|uniref:Uncharacterized protein n=1 Tax=Rhizobium grahamii CCGE 502 TaxID=990285 RepID=S3HC02_9HYPH|nr:hypothetical protein RGCCGE502_21870 [Rhizobium grahamii CCGE 502]